MNSFNSLLLPLDGSLEAARGAGCALWLTEALGATLHVLHVTDQPLPVREALSRLHMPNAQKPAVVLHQRTQDAAAALLQGIAIHCVDLVVMSARGASASKGLNLSQRLGTVAQSIIEHSPVPVLLLPLRYREVLPWTSMLVAASGDRAADEALGTATQLAAALNLKVIPIHIEETHSTLGANPLSMYVDAAHYEYAPRMEEMVERGLTTCTEEERQCVKQILLRRGGAAEVLLEQTTFHHSSLLALGWHGEMGSGRALVLKRLLEEAECALLLVRKPEKSSVRLKIGKALDE